MAKLPLRMLDLIAQKREGLPHSKEELAFIANAAARGSVPDYQLSAWLMAVCLNGMKLGEAAALTRSMADAGERLDLSFIKGPKLDKHSTGGVGDGISLALAPLAAAAGLVIPMMSGRGLGHTGGTLDKLESIPGFRVRLTAQEIKRQLSQIGVCLFGQTDDLAPSDRKLYELRDATATVQSLPLIVSSILSKKMTEDLDALVFDVKIGSGAIFKTEAEGVLLAKALVKTAKLLGLKTVAVLTAMDQPLGRFVGNALEVRQAVEILHGDRQAHDYRECLLGLAGWMAYLGGKAKNPEDGARLMEKLLDDGSALKKFRLLIEAQGGDPRAADDPQFLPTAPISEPVASPKAGFISRLDARAMGLAAVILGAGREKKEDAVDAGAGIHFAKKVGDRVGRGEVIAHLYSSDEERVRKAQELFTSAVSISPKPVRPTPTIRKVIR